jgi:PAS domain S-box-containing protein
MNRAVSSSVVQETGQRPAPDSVAPWTELSAARWPIGAAVLATALFWVELVEPVGPTLGALHVLVVLLCLRAPHPKTVLVAAGLSTVLVLLPLAVVPSDVDPMRRAVGTGGILAATWITALFIYRFVATTRQRVEGSLRELADTKYALDQAAIVATTDTRGVIKSVNRKFCEISKYQAGELIGNDHRLVNSGYHPKEFIRSLWTTIANGRIWTGEIRNRAKDGTTYWVDTTIVPFLDARGKPYQYVAIRHDITERKRSEQKLREQEALARLGEMAAVVAHEVKNPLAGIKGVLQVIGARMPVDSRDRKVIGDVLSRLDSLNEMVKDLLLFARPTMPTPRLVHPHNLVQSTADLLHRDPEAASVEVRISGSDVPFHADPEQLSIVLTNLLLNAAQAMGGKGRIDVTTGNEGGLVRMTVRDHGPGVLEEVKGRMFDAFFTTKHRGTGLGLPTARRLVELNGGEIAAESEPDGGTSLILTFPAAPQDAGQATPDQGTPAS